MMPLGLSVVYLSPRRGPALIVCTAETRWLQMTAGCACIQDRFCTYIICTVGARAACIGGTRLPLGVNVAYDDTVEKYNYKLV